MKKQQGRIWPRLIVGLAAVLMVFGGLISTASATVIDRIVAQINDEIITLYELEEAALPYLVQHGRSARELANEERRAALLEEVLEDLIDRILVEQEAEEMGVAVSEAEINGWMQQMRQQQGLTEAQFRQMIAQYGIDYDDYRAIVHDNLLRMNMIQMRGRSAAISEAEVDSVYRRQFGRENVERHIEIRHILIVPDEATGGEAGAIERAQALRDRIEAGESFGEIAEAESQGPGNTSGGYLGTFQRGDLEESFEEAAFGLAEGELSQPVRTAFGIHLIEVLSVEERAGGNVEQRRAQIRARLQQREMERQMESFLQTLRARAFVDVRY